ncbi:sensor histidine kinase [Brachybacterium paraconglomeratum]|uniref:sensor histidine kinase n=1 Tax=Brachybacterium paraconglomeratum TaxID=173362 RepID=UPI0021A59470|nr:HAMP domain-containing sensor histidine kinase [Brachybacterium paraconglomeratum]MCT1910397.1 HAMP domain-containing histidine kinase [Brachybacterium paraconglomeratum]
MALPSLRTERPMSLWTRIVALISLLLVLGVVVTGSLSLFLLNRTLIQSVDNNLQSSVSEMLSLAQHELAGDDDAITSSTYIPVEYAVEVRDEQGRPIEQEVFHYGTGKVSVQFPDLTDEQILQRGGRPFTVLDSAENRWRVIAMVNSGPDKGSVYVALPLTSVDRTMHEMALIIVLVGTLVVLVGMGAGGYVTHRALEPLRDVEATASQIAGGDLSQRVPVTDTSLEVHDLALSLNEMLVRIEQAFAAQSASEERATASEARMRRFVGDASHELRTPLAAIRGFGELYRMGALRTDEDTASAMRRIEDEARRMGSLVENLLRLARLDERPELDLEPLDLTDALFDAAQDLRALDPDRQVMVVSLQGTPLSVQPHVPFGVLGDEASLRQVILNLVGNANRHTPKGSPVEFAVGRLEDGRVRIEVRDHGEGIDDDQREKVFERFYRTDSSRVRSASQGGGAGLGLSIAATIVQQHRGAIGVQPTPGGGATFWIELQGTDLDPEQQVEPDQLRALTRSAGSPDGAGPQD